MYCYYKCSVALPHGAVGWSAVCDWGISWSYSLTFWYYSCLFFSKSTLWKKYFRNTISVSNSLDPDPVWHLVCNVYKQLCWHMHSYRRQDGEKLMHTMLCWGSSDLTAIHKILFLQTTIRYVYSQKRCNAFSADLNELKIFTFGFFSKRFYTLLFYLK